MRLTTIITLFLWVVLVSAIRDLFDRISQPNLGRKWQYKFVQLSNESLLDYKRIPGIEEDASKLGEDHWELVNVIGTHWAWDGRSGLSDPVLVYKRPKPTSAE